MSSSPVPSPDSSFVILWAGENPVLHAALLEQLDLAGIPCVDEPIGEDEAAPTADPLPIDWKPRFGFQVAVHSTDFAKAQAILDPLLELELEPLVELPAEDDAAAADEEVSPACKEETATFQVWSSDEPKLARFIVESLRENEIPTRAEALAEQTAIFVPPACELRAREIIREVIEATPPA
jgi:hypothetical protein